MKPALRLAAASTSKRMLIDRTPADYIGLVMYGSHWPASSDAAYRGCGHFSRAPGSKSRECSS